MLQSTTNTESVVVQKEGTWSQDSKYGVSFFMNYKRKSLDPTELSGIYGVSIGGINKVAEIMDKFMELYQNFGFRYLPRSQVWIDKKKKSKMNLRDLQRVIVSSYHFDKIFVQLIKYLKHHGNDSWVKLLKWKFASFFSYEDGQDIPKSPISKDFKFNNMGFFKPGNLFGGTYHDFFQKMKSKDRKISDMFKNTVLNGMKKGAPRVSKDFLDLVKENTWNDLTTRQEIKDSVNIVVPTIESITSSNVQLDMENFVVTKIDIQQQLRRTVFELFRGITKSLKKEILRPKFPSTSSNYNYSRNAGGAVGGYFDFFTGQSTYEGISLSKEDITCLRVFQETGVINQNGNGFQPNQYFENIGGKSVYYHNTGILFNHRDSRIDIGVEMGELLNQRSIHYGSLGIHENNIKQMNFEAGIEDPEDHEFIKLDPSDCIKLYQDNYFRLWRKATLKEEHRARIIVLSEPLKGRPITAEDWDLQFLLKPFQKALHSRMRKIPVFRLIGTPLTEDMIKELFDNLHEKRVINSGDYANATNNMYPWASECCIDAIIEIIEKEWEEDEEFPTSFVPDLKKFLYFSMTRHTFVKEEEIRTPILDKMGVQKN